jgi:hypothetical protein
MDAKLQENLEKAIIQTKKYDDVEIDHRKQYFLCWRREIIVYMTNPPEYAYYPWQWFCCRRKKT